MTPYELTSCRATRFKPTTLPPDDSHSLAIWSRSEESPINSSGSSHGERLVADERRRAANGVTETEWHVLVGEADPHVAPDRLEALGHRLAAGRPAAWRCTSSDGSKYASIAGLLWLVTTTM